MPSAAKRNAIRNYNSRANVRLKFLHHLVDGFNFLLPLATYRFVYLEVHSRIALHPDDAQEYAQCLGGFTAFADNLSHVFGMDREREQYAHLIDGARCLDRFGMVDKRLYHVFEKCLVWFHV